MVADRFYDVLKISKWEYQGLLVKGVLDPILYEERVLRWKTENYKRNQEDLKRFSH